VQDIHHRLGVEREVAEGFLRTCTSTWYRVYAGRQIGPRLSMNLESIRKQG